MNTIQAGIMLGVSERRVRALIAKGKIKAEREGLRRWKVSRASVAAYAQTDRRPGRPKRPK